MKENSLCSPSSWNRQKSNEEPIEFRFFYSEYSECLLLLLFLFYFTNELTPNIILYFVKLAAHKLCLLRYFLAFFDFVLFLLMIQFIFKSNLNWDRKYSAKKTYFCQSKCNEHIYKIESNQLEWYNSHLPSILYSINCFADFFSFLPVYENINK